MKEASSGATRKRSGKSAFIPHTRLPTERGFLSMSDGAEATQVARPEGQICRPRVSSSVVVSSYTKFLRMYVFFAAGYTVIRSNELWISVGQVVQINLDNWVSRGTIVSGARCM